MHRDGKDIWRAISSNQQEKSAPAPTQSFDSTRTETNLADRRYYQGPEGMGRIYPWLKTNGGRDGQILLVVLLSKPIQQQGPERQTRSCLSLERLGYHKKFPIGVPAEIDLSACVSGHAKFSFSSEIGAKAGKGSDASERKCQVQ